MTRFAFKHFRSRLLFYFAGLFGMTLAGIFIVVDHIFQQNTETAIGNELLVAERVFTRLLDEREAQLTQWATALAGDYAFKRVMTTPDHATLLSAVRNLSQRVGADAAMLVSTDYQLLVDVAQPEQAGKPPFFATDMIERAEEDGSASTLALIEQQPYQLVAVPILAPDPIAWLCLGFKIDRPLLNQLKQLTQLEISIVSLNAEGNLLHASTLMPGERLPADSDWRTAIGLTNFFANWQGAPYISRLLVLQQQQHTYIAALIQRSWHDALADFYRLRWLMALITGSGMLVILAVSTWLSRTVSRPVQTLVNGARAIGAGDYAQRVKISAHDEIGELGRAFNQMSGQLAEKEKIRNLLGKVVSPAVMAELLHSEVKLGGELREISALFSDLAGFTTLAEAMQPEPLVALLNQYLTQMSDRINGNDGVIDKFIGDAIVAFWGAPVIEKQHAILAVKSALAMQQALAQLREQWAKQGLPLLSMRIGINTGPAVVGNMGSSNRMDYTIMGDTVNLAARLEGANKYYGSDILLSEHTYKQVKDAFLCRELDRVRVQGKSQSVAIYQLLGEHGNIQAEHRTLVEQFAPALQAFRERRWDEAETRFRQLIDRYDDNAGRLYLQRIGQLRATPPDASWDGVYDLQK